MRFETTNWSLILQARGPHATPAREALRKAALWFCREGYVKADASRAAIPRLEAATPAATAAAGAVPCASS